MAGLRLEEFWSSTLSEVKIYFDAYQEKQKSLLSSNYTLAQLIGIAVASYHPLSQGKVKYPKIYECFPEVFKEEKKQAEEQSWQLIKARLLDFTYKHNKQREV